MLSYSKSRSRFKLLIFGVFLFMSQMSLAQGTISGSVTDENGDPLVGANVVIDGTNQGSSADVEGQYSISVDGNGEISITATYIGYVSQTQTASAGDVVNFRLATDAFALDVLIVTAQKRVSNIQKVPIAITALTPQGIQRSGSQNFEELSSGIPNLSFAPQGGTTSGRAGTNITIRGITGQNTTAMYLDETPLPENIDIRLLDVARVEILNGPQGTLYGSNSMGGAVKTITELPSVDGISGSLSTTGAAVTEGAADYSAEGIVNIPLGSKLAFRAGGFYDFQTGIYDREFTQDANIRNIDEHPEFAPTTGLIENIDDVNQSGFHVSLGFFPTDNLSFVPKVIMQNAKGTGYDFAEGDVDSFTQTRSSNIEEGFEDNWIFYSLNARYEIANGAFVSSTSFLNRDIKEKEDTGEATSSLYGFDNETLFDFYAGTMFRDIQEEQFTQEIRFASGFEGKFEFTAGGFYSTGKSVNKWSSFLENLATDFGEPEDYDTYVFDGLYEDKEIAFFAEAYYDITEKLKLTAGLRYFNAEVTAVTYEDGFNAGGRTDVNGSLKETGVNPKFSLAYDISASKLLYATVAKGYRLGGVNDVVNTLFNSPEDDAILAQLPGGEQPDDYDSDFLWNYELGFKATWANGKYRTNVSLFYNDWQNLQQAQSLTSGYSFISNVGSASSKGIELDLSAKLAQSLTVSGGLGLVSGIIEESSPYLTAEAGDRIQFTPDITANLVVDYNKLLNSGSLLYANLSFQHVGERLNTFDPEEPINAVFIYDPYSIVNARVGMEYKSFDFSIFAQNLLNQQANYGSPRAFSGEVPGRPRFSTNRPLTTGIEVTVLF